MVDLSTTPRHLRHLLRMALGPESLGRLIARAREDAGLSQSELADRIGLAHPQSISNYERGVTEIPSKRLRRIAEATGKPLSFFLLETGRKAEDRPDATIPEFRAELAVIRELLEEMLERLPARPDTGPAESETP